LPPGSSGIETVQELLDKPLAELIALPLMNEKTAEKALAVARYALATHKPEVATEVAHHARSTKGIFCGDRTALAMTTGASGA
jgi:hypothetical protein